MKITIDPYKPPEKGPLIVILPNKRAIVVETDNLDYVNAGITDIPNPEDLYYDVPRPFLAIASHRYAITISGEMRGYAEFRSASLKRVMRYLDRKKKEAQKCRRA